jgi:hypothetical protein
VGGPYVKKCLLALVASVVVLAGCGSAVSGATSDTSSDVPSAVTTSATQAPETSLPPATPPAVTTTTAPAQPVPVSTKAVAPNVVKTTTKAAVPPPVPVGCHPVSNSGTCYEPGEFCRNTDHGVTGLAGDGKTILCENNNGWRWEPV